MRANETPGQTLFASMREPASGASCRKDGGEGIRREAERFKQERGLEFHIHVEGPLRLVLMQDFQRSTLDSLGKLQAAR